ncbi:molecular chaperone DnaJ [Clostridium sp.]|uniref:tetratricopeptide repeat protein n=1 Tax=Clostridium sp. TaxID=1506 RepID=UPI00262D25C2|nr:molecular chaperone DnaJ [Clostridium sp.]
MDNSYSINNNSFITINNLINKRDFDTAEGLLNSSIDKNADYHYLYSLLLEKKAWFDESLKHLKIAVSLSPNNTLYKESLITLMGRHRHYSDDYYHNGYRRRNRGCACCCCDDCCDCGNFSCCDLICLDQCCECMGGDLIECI